MNSAFPAPSMSSMDPVEGSNPRVSGIVELPSRGKFYGDACPDGVVEIYPMTGRDEAVIADISPSEIVDAFDILLKRCLKTKIDPDDMLSTDKFYLILRLRANSYGPVYEFKARCPNCGVFSKTSCDIPDSFTINWYAGDGKEPFEVELPLSKYRVGFRILRGKDERDVLRWRKRELDRGIPTAGDPSHIYKMAKHIVSINGKTIENIGEAMRFYENLIARDASALANAIDKHNSGVNTEMSVDCLSCKSMFRISMPFTAGFFRSSE